MQVRQLDRSNLLLTPLYVYKLEFISNELRSLCSAHD